MAKVSIVVPVYNVEKYIHKCVDSMINQTMKDIEIILIDDGTKDSSGIICDDYAQKDERIVVIHKENGGISDARNVGMEKATSKYILFIDSDDYIKEDMVEKLYTMAELYKVDVAACGVYNVYANGAIPQCSEQMEFCCDNVTAFSHILVGKLIPGTICNKLIKTEIAKKILFPKGKIYEDAFYTTQLIQIIKKVYVTTEPMYYYFHRQGSTTTTPFREKDMDVVKAFGEALEIVKEKYPEILEQAEFRLEWAHFTVLDRMLLLPEYKKIEGFKEVVAFLRGKTVSVLRSKYFYKTRKIGMIALFIHVKLYKMLVIYNSKKNAALM